MVQLPPGQSTTARSLLNMMPWISLMDDILLTTTW